jgi:hypothetical protein
MGLHQIKLMNGTQGQDSARDSGAVSQLAKYRLELLLS